MYNSYNFTFFKPSYNQRFEIVGVMKVTQSGIKNSGLSSKANTLITLQELGGMV